MAPARGQPPLSRNQSFSPSKAPLSHRNSSVGKGKGKLLSAKQRMTAHRKSLPHASRPALSSTESRHRVLDRAVRGRLGGFHGRASTVVACADALALCTSQWRMACRSRRLAHAHDVG